LLAHDQWFSPGTLASSTTKTGCHDIEKNCSLDVKEQSLTIHSSLIFIQANIKHIHLNKKHHKNIT
jgi:phosphohistidine swiveling domain-containing protein